MVDGVCVHDLDVHEPCLEVLCLDEGNARRQLSLDFDELLRRVSILSDLGVSDNLPFGVSYCSSSCRGRSG